MVATRDPDGKVVRNPVKEEISTEYATPCFPGEIIPGEKTPRAFWLYGDIVEETVKIAMAESPEVKRLGIGPQSLETGLELLDEESTLHLADPRNADAKAQSMYSVAKNAEDREISDLDNFVEDANKLIQNGALVGKVPPKDLCEFHREAEKRFEGPLRRFTDVVPQTSCEVLLLTVQDLTPVFAPLSGNATRDQFLAARPSALKELAANKSARAAALRTCFQGVAQSLAGVFAYRLNSKFSGEFGLFHIPRDMPQAKVASFVIGELIEKKKRCYDVIMLNPLTDPNALTTHWSSYFTGEEQSQAEVFASLAYESLPEFEQMASYAVRTKGSAAGHFALIAGYGDVLGVRTPLMPGFAGSRRQRDELRNPKAGHYGVLESSFGPHPDRAIFGYENIDLFQLRDWQRAKYAKVSGINTPAFTDGLVHLFRAVSQSKDRRYSQFDAVRAANWFIGTLHVYMRSVTIGQCNDETLKKMVAAAATELLNREFAGKSGFVVVVTPGNSSDPREFTVTLSLPDLTYVESFTIYVDLRDPAAE